MAERSDDAASGEGGKPVFSFGPDSGTAAENGNAAVGTGGKTVDPASIGTGSANSGASDTGKRGRGRPKGSGKAKAGASAAPLDLTFIEFSLFGIHTMLASVLSMPTIQLTEDEGKQLARAIQNVSQYYSVALDPKMQAWGALIMTAGSIYGTRFAAHFFAEKGDKEQPAATVHQLRP